MANWEPIFIEIDEIDADHLPAKSHTEVSRTSAISSTSKNPSIVDSALIKARLESEPSMKNFESSSSNDDITETSIVQGMSISQQLRHFGIKSQEGKELPKPKDFLDGVDISKLSERTQIMFDKKFFRINHD